MRPRVRTLRAPPGGKLVGDGPQQAHFQIAAKGFQEIDLGSFKNYVGMHLLRNMSYYVMWKAGRQWPAAGPSKSLHSKWKLEIDGGVTL